MKRIVRLTESDLTRIVRRVLKEEETLKMDSVNKITESASSLLNNDSETFNTSIGVKNIPACFRGTTELQKLGVTDDEVGVIIDMLDWPMSSDDAKHAKMWAQGSGVSGSFGGNFSQYGRLKLRIVQNDDIWYPAVEELRVKYNLDEYYNLVDDLSSEELSGFKSELINAYQTWIDCVNGKKTSAY